MPRRSPVCGYTVPRKMQNAPTFSLNTQRYAVEKTLSISLEIMTYIPYAMGTTVTTDSNLQVDAGVLRMSEEKGKNILQNFFISMILFYLGKFST